MRGSVDIYVNKKNKEIYLLKSYKTKIGYWKGMGYLIHTKRELLKKETLVCIRDSLSAYQQDIEDTQPFKASSYKTWNKFFKYHDYISVDYDTKGKTYSITMGERDEKSHSYGGSLPNCEFMLTEAEFHEKFDEIMDFLISKVKMIK